MTKRTESPSDAVKLRVMRRDRFTCIYCGIAGNEAELEIDHITPVSKGGSHHMANLATSCRKCNQKKSDGDLPRKTAQPQPVRQGLVGLWLHTLHPNGAIGYQGTIVHIEDDIALVQLFEWIEGSPTQIVPMSKAEILDPKKCILYPSSESMKDEYEIRSRREDRKLRSVS